MSVAVLPFDVLSRDSNEALTTDGFIAELGVRLTKVDSLIVSSRGQVQRYQATRGSDPIAAGRALNVAYVVSGTWRRSGDRVRITAEMARSADGAQVWADAFERSSADLMGIEADLATAVANAIAGRLRPRDRTALARQPTRVPAAFDQYLRGNALIARRETEGVAGAIEAYSAAVRLDPGFAAAWGRLAEGIALTPYYAVQTDAEAATMAQRTKEAAARALALDSTSAEAWMAQGFVLDQDGRPHEAFAAFARAVSLDSTIAEPHYHLGTDLKSISSDQATAEQQLRTAHILDPTLTNAVRWLTDLLWKEGRTFEALAWFDTLFTMAPALAHGPFTADAHIELRLLAGDTAAARSELADLLSRPPGPDSAWVLAVAARTQAALGDISLARTTLRRSELDPHGAEPLAERDRRLALALAAAHTALGEYPRALDILEARRPVDGIGLWDGLRASYFDPLRREPRFQRLVESVWPR